MLLYPCLGEISIFKIVDVSFYQLPGMIALSAPGPLGQLRQATLSLRVNANGDHINTPIIARQA